MKTVILALTIGLTSLTVNGQTIKDFFIPASPKNKATFYTVDHSNNGAPGRNLKRIIYYINKGSSYDIQDTRWSTTTTRTVTFTSTEAKMSQSVSASFFSNTEKRVHSPSVILLKMPPKGQSVQWTYTHISREVAKYTATWTTVNIDGQNIKTIKVEEEFVDGLGISIEYYVQGIGLWKTDFKSSDGDGKIRAYEKLDQLDYGPTAK